MSTERTLRRRANHRGFQIMRVRGREMHRRQTSGLGRYLLIDSERVHLFAATLKQIDAFLADKPEIATPRIEARKLWERFVQARAKSSNVPDGD